MANQEILFGAGTLYIIPDDIDIDNSLDELVKDALIKIGESSGEATLNVTQNFADVRGGALNQELGSFMTSEEVLFNAGICTFDMEKIAEVSAAYFNEDVTNSKRTLGIGGMRTVPIKQLRYVHTKRSDGKELYIDMFRAQNRSGLQMTFNPEAESVFNFEFKLLADPDKENGNIVRITEEF
ncbi:hypothetical protein LG307_14750 [Sutcliffiella horikoshii]|uniref:hypothetical protein n=1 Tax=Sutcliffiella horikoshii TaxID=79883 RepID=UPI00384ECA93